MKGETLMEHETVQNRETGTKRILTGIVGGGAATSLLSAVLRVAVSPSGDYSSPLNGLLGLGIIPFRFVASAEYAFAGRTGRKRARSCPPLRAAITQSERSP